MRRYFPSPKDDDKNGGFQTLRWNKKKSNSDEGAPNLKNLGFSYMLYSYIISYQLYECTAEQYSCFLADNLPVYGSEASVLMWGTIGAF